MSKLAGMTKGFTADKIESIKNLKADKIALAVGAAAKSVAVLVQRDCTKVTKSHEPQAVKLIGLAVLYLVGAMAMGVIGLCWLAPRIHSVASANGHRAASVVGLARYAGKFVPAFLFALLTFDTLTNRVPLSLFGFAVIGVATVISARPAVAPSAAGVAVA